MKKVNRKRSQEPSRASLRAMPEADFSKAKPNRYARRIATEGFSIQVERGRPRKGTEKGPTIPRSVRFPAEVWENLEQRAKQEGIPLHAALRAAVLAWLESERRRHPSG